MSNLQIPEGLKDFRNFLFLAWKFLGLPEPTPLQYALAHRLQHGPDRQCNAAYRGFGKSWITSLYTPWRLLLNPNEKILVVSASKPRADDFTTFVRKLLDEMPELQHLAPQRDAIRDSKLSFDVHGCQVEHAPSVKSVGVTGQMTGSRANIIVADDIESLSNSDTLGKRERLAQIIKEFDSILSPGGQIIFLGTPQTEESIYNLLPDRGYEKYIIPARMPSAAQMEAYGPEVAQEVKDLKLPAGAPTDPLRFDEEELLIREASYGRSGFALQFMLDTSLADAERFPLKLSDLVVMDLDRKQSPGERIHWGRSPQQVIDLPAAGLKGDRFYRPFKVEGQALDYERVLMGIDPSGRGADETSYCIVALAGGYYFLLEQGGFKGGYETSTLNQLAERGKYWGANLCLVESNFGDGMFTQLFNPFLRKIHPMQVEEIRHSTQKERRIIEALEPVMNQHRLVVNTACVERDGPEEGTDEQKLQRKLFYQLTRMQLLKGALKHDDRVDCLAMILAYLVEELAVSAEDQAEQRQRDFMAEELRKWQEQIGAPVRGDTWITSDQHGSWEDSKLSLDGQQDFWESS